MQKAEPPLAKTDICPTRGLPLWACQELDRLRMGARDVATYEAVKTVDEALRKARPGAKSDLSRAGGPYGFGGLELV